MSQSRRITTGLALAAVMAMAGPDVRLQAQQGASMPPTNEVANPYNTITDYFKLPEGRKWGSTSAVDVAPDGRTIWVAERCGGNSCLDRATGQMSQLPTVLKFDQSGKLLASFGEGLLIFPHGIHVDRDGNVWVTDGQDNAPTPARGGAGAGAAPGAAPATAAPAAGTAPAAGRGAAMAPRANPAASKGHQVFKFSPEGKLLLTMGKPGGGNAPDYFFQPNDVITNAAGEIFVSEGHAGIPGTTARIIKFAKDGKTIIKEWGTYGDGPGQLNQPHAMAFDSQGRLFVGDRGNNRVVIFDQDGKYIDAWYQFSRPSGIYIDKTDNLYVADSESGSVNPAHGAWKRGIRIGSIKDGKVVAFIPDPDVNGTGTLAAEGVVVDAAGNVYGAEVGPRQVKKYVKK